MKKLAIVGMAAVLIFGASLIYSSVSTIKTENDKKFAELQAISQAREREIVEIRDKLSGKNAVQINKEIEGACHISVIYIEVVHTTIWFEIMPGHNIDFMVPTISVGRTGGSGCITENGILTAGHLFPENAIILDIDLAFKNGQVCDNLNLTNIIKIDHDKDLALLSTPENFEFNGKLLQIAKSAPKVGEIVFALGCPGSFWASKDFFLSVGYIGNISLSDGTMCIYHSAMLNPGNSGGPLLNSRGEVVGVNVACILNFNTVNISVLTTQEIVEEFLKN